MVLRIEQERKRGVEPELLYSDEDKCSGDGREFFDSSHSPHVLPAVKDTPLVPEGIEPHMFRLLHLGLPAFFFHKIAAGGGISDTLPAL